MNLFSTINIHGCRGIQNITKQKTTFFISLLLVCLILFVSCGASGKKSTAIPELKLQFIGAPPSDSDVVEGALNEYLEANEMGFRVDMNFTDFGDFNQKASIMINTGEAYDIVFTSSWGNDYVGNVNKNAFLDLTPYLEQEEFSPLYNAIDPRFWEGAKINGNIYAVPTQKEIGIMGMYLFNKEIVEELGFDYEIKSIKDAEPYLSYIKDKYSNVTPLLLFNDRTYRGTYDYLLGYDLPFALDNNNKFVNMYDLPDVKNYVYTIRDFFLKGYINQDAATRAGRMQKGEVYGMSLADGQPFAEVTWSFETGYDLVASLQTSVFITTGSTRGAMLAINVNSEHPVGSLEFLQLVNTNSDFHNLLNYGIEGIHYNKVGKNTLKRTEAGENNYLIATFGLGNLFNTYLLEGEPENKWEVFQEVNNAAISSDVLGLTIDTTEIINELAGMNSLAAQYEPLIRTGSVDPDSTLTEFKTKLDEAGFEKVRSVVQKQVDDFLASK